MLPPFVRRYNTRFSFRFVITSPKLTQADCFGITRNQYTQFTTGQVENIDRSIEPGRPSRFPQADKFTTAEQASLECDRWRFHLEKNFGVKIEKWSCGNRENLLMDTRSNLDGPVSLELEDFIERNRDALESHRASQDTTEKQLRWLSQHGEPAQRQRALTLIAKQEELLSFCQRNDVVTLRKKAESLAHYTKLCLSPLESMAKATTGIEGASLRAAITRLLNSRLTVLSECDTILSHYAKLTDELNKLKNHAN